MTEPNPIENVVLMLRQILQLYKDLGPQSMESLTKSYLGPAPTAETATDAAEGMMAQAFRVFDEATDSALTEFAARQGFDLSKSVNYKRRMDEGYFRVFYPAIVMYVAWLDREGQKKGFRQFGQNLQFIYVRGGGLPNFKTRISMRESRIKQRF